MSCIAILLLISACLGRAQIRGSPHEGHFQHKNRNAMKMMKHHKTFHYVEAQWNPNMQVESQGGSLVRLGNNLMGGKGGMMRYPSKAATRAYIEENTFRGSPWLQTSQVTTSSTRHEFQNRIVGGVTADTDAYKFFASLDIGCGGSLIAPNFVLTAAHCAGSINTVRIGSNEVNSEGSLNSVVTECVHPDYEPSTTTNDYMLLKLQSPVDTNTYPTIELNNDNSVPQVDQLLTVIGFGATSEGGSGSTALQQVEVPVDSHEVCNEQYGGNIVQEVMFCAGFTSGGKDSCQGDSGGPIFEVRDGQPVQVGVVSFGEGCARPNKSGVYARVSGAYDWIQSTMKKLNEGDTSGCSGGSIGGSDDDSFPTQAPVQGPTGNEPSSGNEDSPTSEGQPTVPAPDPTASPVSGPLSTSGPVSVAPILQPTTQGPVGVPSGVPVDDSFPNQAPAEGPTGNEPSSGNEDSPTSEIQLTVPAPASTTIPVSLPIFTDGPVSVAPITPHTTEAPIGASSSAHSEPSSNEAPSNASPTKSDDPTDYDGDGASTTDDFWNWWE
jgi:trypsin